MFRYGIDAPFWVFFNLIFGGIVIVSNLVAGTSPGKWYFVFWGGLLFLIGLFMLYYSGVSKLKHRDRILQAAGVKPGSHLLDVGTGRGLLAIEAAKMGASTVAVDVWSKRDLGGNGREAFNRNAAAELVASKIRVFEADVRKMSFQKQTFDSVVSNFVIHNLSKNRDVAVKEMWRVLKPGGVLVISDIRGMKEYKGYLENFGNAQIETKGPYFDTFPFARMLVATKRNGSGS
ncbi:MAG: Methyltransferase type 11 [Bacilli bacterium]|nr:Methyltransferase type 11 [Bacilli bacterium]